jgi:hypothetical protein
MKMGKALAILGLLLIIVGLLPVLFAALGLTGFDAFIAYFYMLNIYEINLGGYWFSELMLGLIGLGFILLVVGALK